MGNSSSNSNLGSSDSSSSGAVGMGPDTPVAFSLPSQPPGEVDAAGLCTVVILRRLERAHNEIVGRFHALLATASASAASLSAGTGAGSAGAYAGGGGGGCVGRNRGGRGEHNKVEEGVAVGEAEEEEEEEAEEAVALAPALSYRTAPSLARRALLSYDRRRDLTPLLSRFCAQQPLGSQGGNGAADFDGAGIEKELAKILRLSGRGVGAAVLSVRQFEYAGESLRARGTLAALALCVPQKPLPALLRQALETELSTKQRLTELLRVLQTAANVVANGFGTGSEEGGGGGGGRGAGAANTQALDPHTSLTLFVEATLVLSPNVWRSCCPATVAAHATLAHLRDLLLAVEAVGLGRAPSSAGGQAVAVRFTAPLDSKSEGELRHALKDLLSPPPRTGGGRRGLAEAGSGMGGEGAGGAGEQLSAVLGVFRDLLDGPLAEPSTFGEKESLKAFLGYQDDDLNAPGSWFADFFPHTITLAHAFEAYLLLAATSASSEDGKTASSS
mmetsp:Transcript_39889/g.67884  ORF Transcript_39889/g.67884 Transcript_39889/m.67884 type:complete len:502 (-) Transcript_39889:194-1699(-)